MSLLPTITDIIVMIFSTLFWLARQCTTRSGVQNTCLCRIMKQKKKNYISNPLTMLCLIMDAKLMEISVKTSTVLDHHQRSTFLSLIQKKPDSSSASKFQSVGCGQVGKVEIVKVIRIIHHAQVSVPNIVMKQVLNFYTSIKELLTCFIFRLNQGLPKVYLFHQIG